MWHAPRLSIPAASMYARINNETFTGFIAAPKLLKNNLSVGSRRQRLQVRFANLPAANSGRTSRRYLNSQSTARWPIGTIRSFLFFP
jgi:hypothetical protein